MAKFYGEVGFGVTEEVRPGVWQAVIVEKLYYGNVLQNVTQITEDNTVNNGVSVSNSISIMADGYANEHVFAIRYVKWAGTLWNVSNIEIKSPRLILRVGGVYNGETP